MADDDEIHESWRTPQRLDVHLFVHFPEGIPTISVDLNGVQPQPAPPVAVEIGLIPGTPTIQPSKGPIAVAPVALPLQDNQESIVALILLDDKQNTVTGDLLDAGTVTAVSSDSTVLTAVVSADQSSVTVAAVGPLNGNETVTVEGSLNGVPLTAGVLAVDVTASAPVAIGLVPGTPTAIA